MAIVTVTIPVLAAALSVSSSIAQTMAPNATPAEAVEAALACQTAWQKERFEGSSVIALGWVEGFAPDDKAKGARTFIRVDNGIAGGANIHLEPNKVCSVSAGLQSEETFAEVGDAMVERFGAPNRRVAGYAEWRRDDLQIIMESRTGPDNGQALSIAFWPIPQEQK